MSTSAIVTHSGSGTACPFCAREREEAGCGVLSTSEDLQKRGLTWRGLGAVLAGLTGGTLVAAFIVYKMPKQAGRRGGEGQDWG